MTYECTSCQVRWQVFMTKKGACPSCGGGTIRTNEPASPNATRLHKELKAKGQSADLHDRFDAFYADRERKRDAELEALVVLPSVEPPSEASK